MIKKLILSLFIILSIINFINTTNLKTNLNEKLNIKHDEDSTDNNNEGGIGDDGKTMSHSVTDILQSGELEADVLCQTCVIVVARHIQGQPFLCSGFDSPAKKKVCVHVMESLLWWLSNEVYWSTMGCEMQQLDSKGNPTGELPLWSRPCPPHVICGWIQYWDPLAASEGKLANNYCDVDKRYPKPT